MLFNINGVKFEADMLDYDYTVKVEEELENVKKKISDIKDKAILDGMRQSVLIKESTEVIHNFFDSVFGDGAANKIFEGKIHYGNALKAFGDYVIQKNEGSGDDIRLINDPYEPKINATLPVAEKKPGNAQHYNGNRQQRRQASKNKGKNHHPNKQYRK